MLGAVRPFEVAAGDEIGISALRGDNGTLRLDLASTGSSVRDLSSTLALLTFVMMTAEWND
jgi:hypothetical protein